MSNQISPDINLTEKQASALLNLPCEIKNAILELVHPDGISVMVSARKHTTDAGTKYAFHPASPPLAATCRRLRAEFPVARYYANNTFILTDTMFQPNLLPAFVTGRSPAVQYMRHVRARQRCEVAMPLDSPIKEMDIRLPLVDIMYLVVRFEARMNADGGLQLDKLTGTRGWDEEVLFLCFCTLQEIVEKAKTVRGSAARVTLMEVLDEYARIVGQYERRLKNMELADGWKECRHCREIMGA